MTLECVKFIFFPFAAERTDGVYAAIHVDEVVNAALGQDYRALYDYTAQVSIQILFKGCPLQKEQLLQSNSQGSLF